MDSKRELENYAGLKRMALNNILSEENVIERNSTTSNQPYTKWHRLGIGPCREDDFGSSKDIYEKGKSMVEENKVNSPLDGLHTDLLEEKSSKHISMR